MRLAIEEKTNLTPLKNNSHKDSVTAGFYHCLAMKMVVRMHDRRNSKDK